ncbi:MAG: UvrD-helicase domain-containing protein, partial [Psittacicella sp.]
MENKAISFNILKHPLRGASFIEASAGTGKTYSITSLYLRLILKVGFNLNLQLKVDNILVVTFTKMATSELKTRISLRINSIYKLLTEYKKQISQELGLSEFNLINKNYQDDEIALYLSNYISSFLFPLGNQKLSFENKTHFYSQQDLSNKNNLKKFFRNSIEFLSSSKNSLNYNFIKTDFLNKIDKLTNLKPDYKAKSEDLSKPYTKNNLDSKTQLNLLENILKNNTFDNLIPSLLEFSNSLFKKLILDENDFIELFYNSLIDSIDKNQRILYLSTFMMASNKSYLEATQLYLEKIFINSQDKSFEIIRSIFNKIILKFNHEKDSLEENLEDAFNNKIDNINSSNSLYEKYKNILNNYPQDNLKEILNKSIHEDFNITFQDNNNPLEETKSLIDYLLNLLNQAKDSISDAPIKTIDSFCYQTLEEYAIDAGINYDIEIINSNYELIKEYFIKFWREYFYPLNQEDSSLISKFISRPSSSNIYLISSLIDNGVIQELENEDPKSILINSALNYRKSLQDFKDNWENIKLFLKDNIKTLKEIDSKNTPKALDIFFTEVDSWILENELVPIESIRTKRLTFNILKDYFNDEIIEYLKIFNSNFAISFKNNLLEIIAKFILKNINAYKKLKNQKTYSDVVNYTKDLLINNPSIANNLRNKYPFLIVDEFQDTNITQYNIFQSIYKDILKPITKEKYKKDNQSYSGAIMIGDPKQAIYAFRGADVFAYIEIKKQFNLTYNLDTNYRSSYELINFTNKLFSFNRNILESRLENSTQNYYCFYQDKIYYNLVKSNNKQGSVQLNSKLKKIDPINFYLSPENNIKEIANRCALNIKYYLNNVSNNGNPIYPQDIAIIVQNESEAIIMKNSLNKLNLDSVYLSQKENILRSDTAKEICLILKAFLQPFKEEILIEALNTTIMSLSSQEIFNIKTNESLLNSYINKFNTFSITWYKEGISSALYSFILIYDIFSRSKLYENKRMMIDISHIIEILSLQESKISGTTNLLTWLE